MSKLFRYQVTTATHVSMLDFSERWDVKEVLEMLRREQGFVTPDLYINPEDIGTITFQGEVNGDQLVPT